MSQYPYITSYATDVIIPEKPIAFAEAKQVVKPPEPSNSLSDRFRVQVVLNGRILVGGTGFPMMVAGWDRYNATQMFNPYTLAQQGIAISYPDDSVDVDAAPNDFYVEDDVDLGLPTPYLQLLGYILEVYNINLSGDPISVRIDALDTSDPESEVIVPSEIVDGTTTPVRDPSALMDNTSLSVSSTQSTALVYPMLEKKGTEISYYPAVIGSKFIDLNTENYSHKLGIVMSFNGGTPKLITMNSSDVSGMTMGGTVSPGVSSMQWRNAVRGFRSVINNAFDLEVRNWIEENVDYDNTVSNPPPYCLLSTYTLSAGSLFDFAHGLYADNSSPQRFFGLFTIRGYSEWLYDKAQLSYDQTQNAWEKPNEVWSKLLAPCYITIYPEHELFDGEGVTINMGLDENYRDGDSVNPFNVFTALASNEQPM